MTHILTHEMGNLQGVFQETLERYRSAFELYIVNQGIPLDERWTVWKQAPNAIKNEEDVCGHDFDFEKDLESKEISWYDDFHLERYSTKDMYEIYQSISEKVIGSKWELPEASWRQVNLDQVREEILRKNIGSVRYDW